MMARTKRSRRSYGAGEWGRNRVRVLRDPKTGILQIEWRENGRRLTRSLNHGDWSRRQADEFAARFASPDLNGKAEAPRGSPAPPASSTATPVASASSPGSSRPSSGRDVRVLDEYGRLQVAMKCAVALEKRARRRAGRGLTERVATWRTVRLAGARFPWES